MKCLKKKWSGLSLVVHQGSSVSGHWIFKPLDWGSNHIDLQRYTVFLILDQPEKTLGSARLKCNFFPFFNLPLVLRSYKFQKIIIMIVYAGHVNWGTYLSISGSTLPSTSAFFFKIMFEIIERILHCSIANGFELYMGFVFKISLLLVRILSVRSRWCQVSYIWSYVVTENDRILFIWNWLKQSRAQLRACFGNRLSVVLYPLSE